MDKNDLIEVIASLCFEYKYPREDYIHLSWRDVHYYPEKENDAYTIAKRIVELIKN